MFKKLIATLSLFATAFAFAAVDANKASQAELDSVKGIGPGTAQKIMDARKAAPFKDWADLNERVKGIGDKRAAKLSAAGLTVNGTSYAGAPATAGAEKTGKKANKAAAAAAPAATATPAAPAAPAATAPAVANPLKN